MGKKTLQGIFIDPPIAIARLGDSETPLDAFVWTRAGDPHLRAETVIAPAWSLDVATDGSTTARMPKEIVFRDDAKVRPVAPFFELWALVGETGRAESTWKQEPLTHALLTKYGYELGDLVLRAEAMNLKAARRTAKPDLRYGTFPPVEVRGDDATKTILRGESPPGAKTPMIPPGRAIPLGAIQMLKAGTNVPGASWADRVDLEVLRFRVTPPAGEFYGPLRAAEPIRATSGQIFPAVPIANAFLNADAKWANAVDRTDNTTPSDTYDVYPGSRDGVEGSKSVGVVDDTSEVRLTVTLRARGGHPRDLTAAANAFIAPPDFAPDRRPFLSIADEMNDRARTKPFALPEETSAGGRGKSRGAPPAEIDDWVTDLFERVYEVVSLFNADEMRGERAMKLPKSQRRKVPIPDDAINDLRAFSKHDKLRDPNIALSAPTDDLPLPITTRARMRHRQLSDMQSLVDFILEHPTRLRALVRPPFHRGENEDENNTSMQMPPFMRNSNSMPLTLAPWQYEMLMAWAESLSKNPRLVEQADDGTTLRALSSSSKKRQAQVTRALAHSARPKGQA